VIDVETEMARVVPVVRALAARGAVVSVDTTKAAVARASLEAGARIVNDVSMGDSVEAMAGTAARFGAAYLRMHSRGTPATMAKQNAYGDVVAEVRSELSDGARAAEQAGIDPSRIMLDPGIGFAKNADQSLTLLANIAELRSLGYALCVGPSRKSFIDAPDAYAPAWSVPRTSPVERTGGTAAAVALAVDAGVEIVRVHDVAVMRQAARIAHATRLRRREARA
jgi:dihydropteroate synthase